METPEDALKAEDQLAFLLCPVQRAVQGHKLGLCPLLPCDPPQSPRPGDKNDSANCWHGRQGGGAVLALGIRSWPKNPARRGQKNSRDGESEEEGQGDSQRMESGRTTGFRVRKHALSL